ncbi:extracellular solute-binding protein, partial [Enterococcus faecium]
QFEEQKAAVMYMGTWYMAGILANKEASKTEVEWGITAIPQKKKGESVTTFGSPTAFAVNKNSKKQKAAQEFIEFAASEEGAKVLAGVGVVPSYRTDEIDQLYFNLAGMPTDEISKKAFSPDEIKLEFPIDTYGPAIDKILQEEYDLVLVGDETPEKGTVNMEKRVAAEKE